MLQLGNSELWFCGAVELQMIQSSDNYLYNTIMITYSTPSFVVHPQTHRTH